MPDTPLMALHRGRIDLLQEHLRRDQRLVGRTFSHQQIYPPELGCSEDHSRALHGTPLQGTILLHISIDFDEIEIGRWLIDQGADANAKAEIDRDGFGGHTPLFNCVVSQAYLCGRQRDAAFARILLDQGADPNLRRGVAQAAAICRRPVDARISRRHPARLGQTLSWPGFAGAHLGKHAGHAADRGARRAPVKEKGLAAPLARMGSNLDLSRGRAAC
jgi:hypothetical protein